MAADDGLGSIAEAAGGAPFVAVVTNPVEEGAFEADVEAGLFGFDPFVAQNLLPLGQEFLVEAGPLDKIPANAGGIVIGSFHGSLRVAEGTG